MGTGRTMYNVADYGVVSDGLPQSADANTSGIMRAYQALLDGNSGGTLYFPPGKGAFVNKGRIKFDQPNIFIVGDSGMGCSFDYAPTSKLIGIGSGDIITMNGPGSTLQGLAFDDAGGIKIGEGDASVKVTASQIWLRDLYFNDCNIAVSMQVPEFWGGQFWLRDILVDGVAKVAGIVGRCGGSAVRMNHVLTYFADPQPFFGIVMESCGELEMIHCDIDNGGTNLALVPGNSAPNQFIQAVSISQCLFDNGTGKGQVYIAPSKNGFAVDLDFDNVWTSTTNNDEGRSTSNGFTLDGSLATPPGLVPAIGGISFRGCKGRNSANHCGMWAQNVTGLTVSDSYFTGNYDGINLGGPCPDFDIHDNHCGAYSNGPVPWPGNPLPYAGNMRYGIILQSPTPGRCVMNSLTGNLRGGIVNLKPAAGQLVAFN